MEGHNPEGSVGFCIHIGVSNYYRFRRHRDIVWDAQCDEKHLPNGFVGRDEKTPYAWFRVDVGSQWDQDLIRLVGLKT